MSSHEEDNGVRDFVSGASNYLGFQSDHFHISIDLDEHRPESAPQNRITAHITTINDGKYVNQERTMKSLKRFKEAFKLGIGDGLETMRIAGDQNGGASLVAQWIADPKTIDRQELSDSVRDGFNLASSLYEKHVAGKPDRQRDNISEALKQFDGQTVSQETRDAMAARLVSELLSRKQR